MKTGVIGAGIGGLTTACLLAADGHEVTVWEKNEAVGGKMNEMRLGDFRFDTGPSLLTMPHVLREIFDYCGKSMDDYLEYIPVDPLCRYFWRDGTVFDCSANLPETLEQIRQFAPDDTESYVKFLGYTADLYDKTSDTFLYNPLHRLADIRKLKKSDFFRIDAFPTVSSRIDKSFKSEYLRQMFKRFATYNGSSPYIAPATLNVIGYVELCLGGFYVKGGIYRLAESLEKLCSDLGVTIKKNAEISKIESTKRQVSGVILKNGSKVEIEALFSNSDATHTYTELVNEKSIKGRYRKQLKKLEPSCSGFVMMLGINKKFDQLKHHNIFFSENYEHEFREIFLRKIMPEDPTIYIADTSYSDPDHAVKGGSNLFILVNSPYLNKNVTWTDEFADEYGERILKKLEAHGLTEIKEAIVEKAYITPLDFHEKYLSNKGSIYGTSSNQNFSAFMRPRNKSPYFNNLYMMGGSTHPGGGVPLVMLSARHAHTLFKRDNE